MEEKEVIEEVKPKNDLEFKVNFGKADRVRLVYIGVSFLLMFASIYKINFMGYSDSVNVIDYAFSGLNFGTLYFIVLVLAIAVEVVVNLQDNDFVKKNKEMLGLAVPVSLFILTLIFIYIGFDLRSQAMGRVVSRFSYLLDYLFTDCILLILSFQKCLMMLLNKLKISRSNKIGG